MKKFSLLISMVCFTCLLNEKTYAQKIELERLTKNIKYAKREDTVRLKLLLEVSSKYLTQQVDSAIKYSSLSIKLASKLKIKKFELEALEYLGRANYGKGNLQKALLNFQSQEKFTSTVAQKAQVIRNQGNVYIELGKTDEALNLYLKSLELANLSNNKLTIAITLSNIAYLLRQQAKYEPAIVHLLKASKIGEEINNKPLTAGIYIQLALVQYSRKIYTDAQDYATAALKIYSFLDNKEGKATAFTIIGESYAEKNNLIEASYNINKAYELNVSLGDKRQIATSAQNLAEIELKLKNYSRALDFANTALEGLTEVGMVNNLITAYLTRGKIFISLKELKKAEIDLNKGLSLSKTGSYRAQEKNAIEALALLKAAEGNYAAAYNSIVTASALNDSLLNEVNSKQINELRTKYETEKNQQQIVILNEKNRFQELSLFKNNLEMEKQILTLNNQELALNNKDLKIVENESSIKQKSLLTSVQKETIKSLNQQSTIQNLELQQRKIYLIVTVVMFLISAFFAYLLFNRRQLKAKTVLQTEINKQQDLAARAVLDAEERERRRIAGDLHDGVGQMLSAALMNMNGLFKKLNLNSDEEIKAQKTLALVNESYDEMRSISHQMMPNALIKSGLASAVKEFLNKIDKDIIKINLETVGLKYRINEQTETVLYRVIQETVNNVIKHSSANKLDIAIIKDEDGVSATIEDNGKGFDKTKMKKDGIGLSNIYSRVAFLKGTVDIDSAPGRGTLVAIHIPN